MSPFSRAYKYTIVIYTLNFIAIRPPVQFHAYAWQRLFYLSKEQKRNLSQEEASMLATNVLLATLVIPVTAEKSASEGYLEIDSTQEKQQRLALLVGLTQPPTRASLIRDLKAKNVLKYVAPELQMLYQWVEDEFHPLQLCDKVTPLLEYIKKDENLDKYTQPLHQTVLVRLLQQVMCEWHALEFVSVCGSVAPDCCVFPTILCGMIVFSVC